MTSWTRPNMAALKLSLFLLIIIKAEAFGFGKHPSKAKFPFAKVNKTVRWEMLADLFRGGVDLLLNKSLFNMYLMSLDIQVSDDCKADLLDMVLSLRNLEGWAVKMIDANGKVPSGMLDGTILDTGSYDECLAIKVDDSTSNREAFRGRYCLVGFSSPLIAPTDDKYFETYGKPPDWITDTIARTGSYMKHSAFWFGTCVPSTCSANDVQRLSYFLSKTLGFNTTVPSCNIDEPIKWTTSSVVAVGCLSFFAGLCVLGTLLDALIRNFEKSLHDLDQKSVMLKALKAFSIVTNTEKWLTINENNVLGCFNGIRFFSATWIILGHTYFFTDTWKFLKYKSPLNINVSFNYWPAAVIENFTVPVESFFFMSGFLLVYTLWKKLEKSRGKLNIIMFIIHKYWRMTPALGLYILLFFILPISGSGPLWDTTLDPPTKSCEARWWTHLLYINNWWDCNDYCLIHTWYLPALMQLHIVGLLVLMLYFRWQLGGILLGLAIAGGGCVTTALVAVWYNFPMPAPSVVRDMSIMDDYHSFIHTKPYSHVTTYLVGMLTAHFALKYKDKKIKNVYLVLGWIVAIFAGLSTVYGIYSPSDDIGIRAFYISCYRIGWAFAVGWVAFVCITGRGGIINRILSWKAFIPLSDLTYLVYLLHPLIMLYKTASQRGAINYGHSEIVSEFLLYTLIAFMMAYVGHIAIERPFFTLEKMIFNRDRVPEPSKTCKNDEPVLTNGITKIITP